MESKSLLDMPMHKAYIKVSLISVLQCKVEAEYISLGELELRYLSTDDMVADILTKPLSKAKFCKFSDALLGNETLQRHFD